MATSKNPEAVAYSHSTSGAACSEGRVAVFDSAPNTVKQAVAAGTTIPAGIFRADVGATDPSCTVYNKGIVPAVSGAAVTRGAQVSFDANGKVIDATTGKYVVGVAEEATTAADVMFPVRLTLDGQLAP